MADLKVWGILPDGTTKEQVILDYTVTGNETDGYDIVISKKPSEEKEYGLDTLAWTGLGTDDTHNLSDADYASISNWDLKNSTVENRATDCKYLYKESNIVVFPGDAFNTVLENCTNCTGLFDTCINLEEIEGIDLDKVTTLDSMLNNCIKLKKAKFYNISNNDICQTLKRQFPLTLEEAKLTFKDDVTSLNGLFASRSGIVLVELSDTRNITDMASMFTGCGRMTSFPDMNTSNVTTMQGMFHNCTALVITPVYDTSKVANMQDMFSGCTSLTTISDIDMQSVDNLTAMFMNCTALVVTPELDTSHASNMSTMFYGCTNLEEIGGLDFTSCTRATNFTNGCTSLKKVKFTNIGNGILDTLKAQIPATVEDVTLSFKGDVTRLRELFLNKSSLVKVNISETANVTSLYGMFNGCSSLEEVDISDTSSVTDMGSMFYGCSSLTTVPEFDTSKVTDMTMMFDGCSSLTTVPEFDTSKVRDLFGAFHNCNDSLITETSRDNILKMCIKSKVIDKMLGLIVFGGSTIDVSKWNTLPSYNDFVDAGWSLD